MVNSSPSRKAHSPITRTPDSSCPSHKKIPWVNPLGNPRHHNNHPQELPQREQPSRGRSASPAHKENEGRGRSPAPPFSKGSTKNFMTPTISAASKVISTSPRRRVLSERNDATRSSFNSSSITGSVESLGSFDFDAKSRGVRSSQDDLDLDDHIRRWESEMESGDLLPNPPPPPPPAPPSHVSPSAASPQTTDLLQPPYDPESNFLSPRPRFLHYKPKLRVDPEGGKHLGASSSSESSDESPERSEDSRSSVTRKSLQEVEEEACEISFPAEVEIGETTSEKMATLSTETTRPRSSFRTKFATFLAILTIVCFCATFTDTPLIPNPTSSPNHGITTIYAPTSVAPREKFAGSSYLSKASSFGDSVVGKFARVFDLLSANFFARFVGNLPPEELGLLRHVNLTFVADEGNLCALTETPSRLLDLVADMGKASEAEVSEEMENVRTTEAETEEPPLALYPQPAVADDESEVGSQIVGGDGGYHSEQLEAMVEQEKLESATAEPEAFETELPNVVDPENNQEHQEHVNEETINHSSPVVGESTESPVDGGLQEASTDSNSPESGGQDGVLETEKTDSGEATDEPIISLGGQVIGDETELPTDVARSRYTWGITLALSTLVLATAFAVAMRFIPKKSQPSSSSGAEMTAQQSKGAHTMKLQEVAHEDGPTEIETLHESGPAASSSLQDFSMKSWKMPRMVMEEDFVVGRERGKTRRDSTASSSSASFGSFTTYQKRSAKKGDGEEVITPVRRSSRIRNQVTSP